MVKNVVHLLRMAAMGSLLATSSAAGAQGGGPASMPQNLAWTMPAPRDALLEKGSAYFSGATGNFVNRESMRANGAVIQADVAAAGANADAQPDLASQFSYVFGGVPDTETRLPAGQKLFSACEVHNCVGSRAFLVTDSTGELVQSAGFLSVKCAVGASFQRSDKPLPSSCDTVPTLTIFYLDHAARQKSLSIEIIKWARTKVAQSKQSDRFKIEEKFLH